MYVHTDRVSRKLNLLRNPSQILVPSEKREIVGMHCMHFSLIDIPTHVHGKINEGKNLGGYVRYTINYYIVTLS